MWLYFVNLLALVSLSGCGSLVQSHISVFHELPVSSTETTYAMAQFPDQKESLEHKTYEQLVKTELNKHGWREVAIDKALLVVFLSYQVDSGKEVTSSLPIIGQTGVSSSSTHGTYSSYGGYGSYSANTTYTPTYGVVGSYTVAETLYTTSLRLDILDRKRLVEQDVKKLYEARVVSAGSSPQLIEVLPTMIQSLFEEFPGKSGSTRKSNRYSE